MKPMNENQTADAGETTPASTDLGEIVMSPTTPHGDASPPPELTTQPVEKKTKRGRPTKAEATAKKAADAAEAAEIALKKAAEAKAEAEALKPKEAATVKVEAPTDANREEPVPQDTTAMMPPASLNLDDETVVLGVYEMNSEAKAPVPATEYSACADVRANFSGVDTVKVYNSANRESDVGVRENYGVRSIILQAGSRAMVPTGLIFDIPIGFKLAVYARSGASLKTGMNLANSVAVIDYDYTDQLYLLIANTSQLRVEILHDDRVAQIGLERVYPFSVNKLSAPPDAKSGRVGGMGHTGVK